MNILIAINEKYIEPAKTMLFSLACHQEENLAVYLLQSSIQRESLDNLRAFVDEKCHGELIDIQIDKSLFANVPKAKWWTEETYYRLISFAILPESVERILWLDADIIVKGNISELYNQDFDDNYAVVCAEDTMKNHARLGLKESHHYFNAGVILYDFNMIRRDFTVQYIFDCIEKHRDHLEALDQDVLNVLFENKVKYIDATVYNNETLGFSALGRAKMTELRDTARIIHFIGAMKPWNPKGANWADWYWWKYEIARGDRLGIAVNYFFRNSPVKFRCFLGEIFYLFKGQIDKISKRNSP